jgi:murein DD-endopeptidase MepM/ murein hydrolase activator NlpD
METNKYQILIGKSEEWHFSLKDSQLKFLHWIKISVLSLAIFGLCLFAWAVFHKINYHKAFFINQNLQKEASLLQANLHQYSLSLSNILVKNQMIHQKFGFQEPSHEIAQMGIGGPVNKQNLLERYTNPSRELLFNLSEATESIERQIEYNQTTLDVLNKNMQQKINSWRHLPTILPTKGRLTSGYGYRIHPVTGERKLHHGLDIANEKWTPIYAPADGVIKYVRKGPHFGNYVAIDHLNTFLTRYGHLAKIVVKPGQHIRRYEVIAYMGNTGRSTGTHLHYEILKNNASKDPKNFILPDNHAVD